MTIIRRVRHLPVLVGLLIAWMRTVRFFLTHPCGCECERGACGDDQDCTCGDYGMGYPRPTMLLGLEEAEQ